MAELEDPAGYLPQILGRYKALQPHNWNVQRGGESAHGGGLEFFHPEEPTNPTPGRPTVEVYDPELKGQRLSQAVFGDMLHYLPDVDPRFRDLRQQFQQALTPEQLDFDRRKHARMQQEGREERSFDDWMKYSNLDAYLRGYLAPDEADEWRKSGTYTPKQEFILKRILQYLETGQ